MPLAIPPELKKIVPFIRRAEELDRDKTRPESRLVAYYLRQFAVQVGIPNSTSSESKVCLGHILESLEAEQADMSQFTREEAALVCRQFSQKVFETADGQDRLGLANQNTAKTFYAASTFLQALEQFGSDEDQAAEDKKKIIYCKWKATDILKALKEGRQPKPGGYGQDELLEDDDSVQEGDDAGADSNLDVPEGSHVGVERVLTEEDGDKVDIEPHPGNHDMDEDSVEHEKPTVSHDQKEEEPEEGTEVDIHLAPPPAYPGPPPPAIDFNSPPQPLLPSTSRPLDAAVAAPASKKKGAGLFGFGSSKIGKAVTKSQLDDAIELTNFALAALHDKDADLAIERLQQALASLGR